jgi:hypothetical protein
MTYLMMALVAGMAVSSDGQERISTETKQHLCLTGEWDATIVGRSVEPRRISIGFFLVEWHGKTVASRGDHHWLDEGRGRLRLVFPNGQNLSLGIYKQEIGQLVICVDESNKHRPTRVHTDEGYILILKPINPSKK